MTTRNIHKLLLIWLVLIALPFAVPFAVNANKNNQCVFPPSGLVGWWPGNGNANDLISDNNGTLEGEAGFDAGQVAQAFLLDGQDDYVRIVDQTNTLDGFTALTIDAWIKPDTQLWVNPENGELTGVIISKYNSTLSNGVSYAFALINGKIRMWLGYTVVPNSWRGLQALDAIPLNEWSHVAVVWAGGEAFTLYVNGQEMPAIIIGEGPIPVSVADNNVPVNIGRIESFSGSYTGPGGYYHGLIDEVDIFSRALAASEIQAIYEAGSNGKCHEFSSTATPTVTTTPTASSTPVITVVPTATPTPIKRYLPAIMYPLPNPTPTSTSTPPPLPRPQLNDGYFQAALPNNGAIWFTVTDGGTKASNAGFFFQFTPFCDVAIHTFSGTKGIDNGHFVYEEYDVINREPIAFLYCDSTSPDQAICHAIHVDSLPGCGSIEGTAVRQQ